MKKLFLLPFVMFSLVACVGKGANTQPENVGIEVGNAFSCVTAEEYANATDLERKIINQIDASVAALEIMAKTYPITELVAMLFISKNDENRFYNSIVIGLNDAGITSKWAKGVGSCRVCGISSGISCVKQIIHDMAQVDEFDVLVKRDGSCYKLTYNN
jgi:hypothetical protein